MEYYLAMKKNETMSLAAMWMDAEIIILGQTEKDKYITYMWHVKKCDKNEHFSKQKQAHRDRKQT